MRIIDPSFDLWQFESESRVKIIICHIYEDHFLIDIYDISNRRYRIFSQNVL